MNTEENMLKSMRLLYMSHIMRSDGLSDPEIRYFQRPALQFSGDIIAAARDSKGDLRIMLADVTGHGLQAALYLLPVSRVFYSMVKRGFMTGDIAREMNQTMREIAVTGRFIMAAVAHIARDGSSIEIWNGGIPTAVYAQVNGELHKFPSQHLPFDNILSALEAHLGGGKAHDDLSIVIAQCRGVLQSTPKVNFERIEINGEDLA
jgi:serine phosphatase RsbU (regulator of sigma subunit)